MEEKDSDKVEKKEEKTPHTQTTNRNYFWSYSEFPWNIKPEYYEEAQKILLKKIQEQAEINDEVNNGPRHNS